VYVLAADLLAVRPVELLGEAAKELDGLRHRRDRPGIDEDERARQRRMTCAQLDPDHPAEAVPHHDRLLDPDLGAKRGHVVGELRDRVAAGRLVAPADAAQVVRRHGVRAREVVELRLEGRVVAAPAGDEEQLGSSRPGTLVVQPDVGEVGERHDAAIVSPEAQKIQVTG
jgi:hypothetical protein